MCVTLAANPWQLIYEYVMCMYTYTVVLGLHLEKQYIKRQLRACPVRSLNNPEAYGLLFLAP